MDGYQIADILMDEYRFVYGFDFVREHYGEFWNCATKQVPAHAVLNYIPALKEAWENIVRIGEDD